MFPYLHIGPLTIPTAGLIIILGLWLGLSLAEKYSNGHGISSNTLYSLVFTSIIAGIITARLAYVVRYPSSFIDNPISIILPNLYMLDTSAGFAGAALVALIFINRKKLDFWQVADALTPALAVFVISLALANFASGDAYGSPTNLPWGIYLWGTKRHPVQLYEMVSLGLILWLLWPSRSWISLLKPGGLFLSFVSLISLNKLIFDAFRGAGSLIFDQYRTGQVVALFILLISLIALRRKLPHPSNQIN